MGRPEHQDHRFSIWIAFCFLCALTWVCSADSALAEEKELSYEQYQNLAVAAHRLDKLALLEPAGDEPGMYLLMGDRYGLVHAYYLTRGKSEEVWRSKQLNGLVDEVIVADLDGDGYEDTIIARTSDAMVYLWDSGSFRPVYQTLSTDIEKIHCFTVGNVDEDDATEIIINADQRLYYIDGQTHNWEWTSVLEYEATRIQCGDVDGDDILDLVLNNGQVVDARTGDVKWEDEVFGSRIELMDIDGDHILEILTESDGTVMKIYDVDHRKEKHLQ